VNSRIIDIVIALVMFAFGAWVFALSGSIRLGSVVGVVGPKFFPQILAAIIMSMSILLGIDSLAHWRRRSPGPAMTTPPPDAAPKSFLNKPVARIVTLVCLVTGYVVALDLLGYRISSVFFVGLLLLFKGMRSPVWVGVASLALVLSLYLLFHVLLSIPLPVGSLTDLR
jgi:putative tricarboxylic transport membrane protein